MKTAEEIFMANSTKIKGEFVMTQPAGIKAMHEFANQWVRVEDKFPKDKESVICFVKDDNGIPVPDIEATIVEDVALE